MAASIKIKLLKAPDIPIITSVFRHTVWKTPASYFEGLLAAQDRGERLVLVACYQNKFAGFVYIRWQSDYPPFAEKAIPEISDLRVLPEFRRRGVATALVDEAEKRIFEKSSVAGIGVGLYADYGAAQRLYVKRGYVPDGQGLFYKYQPVKPGRDVFVDDNLVFYFTKERKS